MPRCPRLDCLKQKDEPNILAHPSFLNNQRIPAGGCSRIAILSTISVDNSVDEAGAPLFAQRKFP